VFHVWGFVWVPHSLVPPLLRSHDGAAHFLIFCRASDKRLLFSFQCSIDEGRPVASDMRNRWKMASNVACDLPLTMADLLLVASVQKCSKLEDELSKMHVAAKKEEERMHELEEAKLEAEEAQLALEENRFEVLQLREELAAAKAKGHDEPGCDVAALQKEVEELRAEKERLVAETAAAKERDRRSRKDLESMTEKSQAVVRLNAQLMTQVKQLKASNAAAGSE
jgi:hypothetical protein